jgi:hypothetical protein
MSQGSRNYSVSGDDEPYGNQQGQYDGWQPNDEQSGQYDRRESEVDYRRDSNTTEYRRDSNTTDYRRESNTTEYRRESNTTENRRESNASDIDAQHGRDDYRQGSQPQGNRNTLQPIMEQRGEYNQQDEGYRQERQDPQWGAEGQWEESQQWDQSQWEAYSPGAAPHAEKSVASINASLQPDSDVSLQNQQYSRATQMSATQNRDANGGYDTISLSTFGLLLMFLLLMLRKIVMPLTIPNPQAPTILNRKLPPTNVFLGCLLLWLLRSVMMPPRRKVLLGGT